MWRVTKQKSEFLNTSSCSRKTPEIDARFVTSRFNKDKVAEWKNTCGTLRTLFIIYYRILLSIKEEFSLKNQSSPPNHDAVAERPSQMSPTRLLETLWTSEHPMDGTKPSVYPLTV